MSGKTLAVDVVLVVEGTVHLAKYFKVRHTVKECGAIHGVVYHIVLYATHYYDLIVVGEGGYQSACRRYDSGVGSGCADGVEDAVLIEVLAVCISVALYQSQTVCKLIGGKCSVAVEGIGSIIGYDAGVLLGDYQVLAGNYVVVVKGAGEGAIYVAVVREPEAVKDCPVDCYLQRSSERRTANHVVTAVGPIINSIVEVVIDSPMTDVSPLRRTVVDAVSIVVRMISPEVAGTVPGHHVTLTGCYPVHVVGVVHTHVVVVTIVEAGIPVNFVSGTVLCHGAVSGKAGTGHVAGGAYGGGTAGGRAAACCLTSAGASYRAVC